MPTEIDSDTVYGLKREVLRQHLPEEFLGSVLQWYVPLAYRIAERHRQQQRSPLMVGINGAQGSGKSTLVSFLRLLLSDIHGLHAVELSIDDFYFDKAIREDLARSVHPLLATRGVPGTHDIELAVKTVNDLALCSTENPCCIPSFDKSRDDRAPIASWRQITSPADVILFEGWCYKAPIADAPDLTTAINELEAIEDADGLWRAYVYSQLQIYHQLLFDRTDFFVFLQIPDFEKVRQWRGLQERKLAIANPHGSNLMSESQLSRFIAHYERITRDCLLKLPAIADVVLKLGDDHQILNLSEVAHTDS